MSEQRKCFDCWWLRANWNMSSPDPLSDHVECAVSGRKRYPPTNTEWVAGVEASICDCTWDEIDKAKADLSKLWVQQKDFVPTEEGQPCKP